jgi:branched-chain amino acid transport system substrate-binding protein
MANFTSVRGDFKFGSNNHPIHDVYIREVVKEGDVFTNKIIGKVLNDHGDPYAKDCKM